MSDQTADLQAWNDRYDAAIEAGADPAEAVAQADASLPPQAPRLPPAVLPNVTSTGKPIETPEARTKRLEFERWNAETEKVKARRAAGLAHEQAAKEARRREFHEAQREAANEKAKTKIVRHHRSLDEP